MLGQVLVWYSTPAPQGEGLPVLHQDKLDLMVALSWPALCPCSSSIPNCTPPDYCTSVNRYILVSWPRHSPHSLVPDPLPSTVLTPKSTLHTGPRPILLYSPHTQIYTSHWSKTQSHQPSSKLKQSPASWPSPLGASCSFARSCRRAHSGGVPQPSSSHPTHCRTDSSSSPSPVHSVRGVWWWTQHIVHYWHVSCKSVQT